MLMSEKYVQDFISAAHQVAQHGLVLCGSGNLSWRVDSERMLITTSGAWMAEVSGDHIALCRIEDGTSLNGKKPSIEIGFHRAILCERQDINVVLHFQ
jgi:L-fuculose-phosphate aldolase